MGHLHCGHCLWNQIRQAFCLRFLNSMKMKLAVVLGVTQMLVGLFLRFSNAMYEKNKVTWPLLRIGSSCCQLASSKLPTPFTLQRASSFVVSFSHAQLSRSTLRANVYQ